MPLAAASIVLEFSHSVRKS